MAKARAKAKEGNGYVLFRFKQGTPNHPPVSADATPEQGVQGDSEGDDSVVFELTDEELAAEDQHASKTLEAACDMAQTTIAQLVTPFTFAKYRTRRHTSGRW